MRLFLQRTPPETKVAAAVLGAALLQVGVLATLGLRSTTERRAELQERLRGRVESIVERSVVGAGAARINVLEQTVEREIRRRGAPLEERIMEALARAPLYEHAYLVDDAGALRDWRRKPTSRAAPTARDAVARERLEQILLIERTDPERVLQEAQEIAGATEDRVAAALALQAGWLAGLRVDDDRALALARRVMAEYATVRDDRGLRGESEPMGLGAAAAVCEIRLRALKRSAIDQAGPYVRAVLDRRLQAQSMRDLISPAGYAVEREECQRLLREGALLPPALKQELRDGLRECDDGDDALDLARSAGRHALTQAATRGESARIFGGGAVVLTVLPLGETSGDGPRGPSAVAFMCRIDALRAAALEPVRQGVDMPEGVALVVTDDAGRTLLGPADTDLPADAEVLGQRAFGPVVPGMTARAVLADPSVLAAETESARVYWLWILAGAGLAVLAASLLAIRAVLREVRLARMKSDFVSNLSHELRTPLTSLRMFVETLQEGRVRDEAEAREYIDVIARETDRLSTLVDRILQFAAFSRGRAPIGLKSVDASEVVLRAVEIFGERAQAAGARIETRIADGLPECMLDKDAMIQVVLNLLDNAVKYGGDNGIRIRVSALRAGPRVQLVVEDDGPGVPERERELVFEEFYRGDDTLSRAVQGTGIGLALCRRIVLAHGGAIDVAASKELGGARFRVTLPEAAVGRRLAVAAQQERD